MRVAVVTGTRRETRAGVVSRWLTEHGPFDFVLHGGASGVDAEAHAWCNGPGNCQPVALPYRRSLGFVGGTARNTSLAALAATLARGGAVVCCCAVPDAQSRGTWDARRKLLAVGFEVDVLQPPT